MSEQLNQLERTALAELPTITTSEALQAWNGRIFGTKRSRGALDEALSVMGSLSREERPIFGRRANEVKQALLAAHETRQAEIRALELEQALTAGGIDVTLPGAPVIRGRLHPSTQTLRRIASIFGQMGFEVYRSPDVETDEMNFELLNFPPHHPARDMQDSFYTTTPGVILRTHTSPGQIHAMHEYYPEPIRVILPGMCYRYEQITARSELQFHQVEGLAVGKNITMTDLKGTLSDFARRMFGTQRQVRFRANYFPFTEPSAEMDVECIICDGDGCNVCKYTGWVEILGCGMVHPTVLRNGGYDPAVYSGFAFGLGPERIAMLKYRIDDIRYFWGNDLRFLEQF